MSTFETNRPIRKNRELMRLKPFVDDYGILRVGGRLQKAKMAYIERHPCVLPGHNIITKLIIQNAHEKTLHGRPQQTIGLLHQLYWILKENRHVKSLIHQCVTCFKVRLRNQAQLMGNLPEARITPSRPFLHTGFSTKSIHLKLVSELSTAAFIAAFKRFVARRGRCSEV